MIEIFEVEQGSPEWAQVRLGLPTASEFATVMAKGRAGEESKTRRTYLLKLAGERLTGEPSESYTNPYMERGKVMEEEARNFYELMRTENEGQIQRVGFIKNETKGCSPDALIGTNGALEIKTAAPHILAGIILKDEFPPEHKAQCQGVLLVAEREWIDLCVYYPKMPFFRKRAYREDQYIRQLQDEIDRFNDELRSVVEKLRAY